MARKTSPTRKKKPRAASRAEGKHLVIVESPAKARTINRYLGPDYVVRASVGHVRDLPKRNPKGVKDPVPGVDLDADFKPTYEAITGKGKALTDLKREAKAASDVWLATDMDREGEAIAWHLAEAMGLDETNRKRVVFNAITKKAITDAFQSPHQLDMDKVNAQQARRILDRIVGYQVSPLLWKKVAGGLSAGRVQSVAVRLVVEREREIQAFVPDEYWKITGYFTPQLDQTGPLADAWRAWLQAGDTEKSATRRSSRDDGRTIRECNSWLNEHGCLSAELVTVDGKRFESASADLVLEIAGLTGFELEEKQETADPKGKGPAARRITLKGKIGRQLDWQVRSLQTKRTRSRPNPPFITSTLQQAAANRLGFTAKSSMRLAQQLYEGVEIGAKGSVGLITYMRTDSTHLATEAVDQARDHIKSSYGAEYLPDKPTFYKSSNKAAQEAHEAIRPTDLSLPPDDPAIRRSLNDQQLKLYRLIWNRFVACQMVPAEWDHTTVHLGADASGRDVVFKCNGRHLIFDGFYKVAGVPNVSDELVLPPLKEKQPLAALQVDPTQHFTSPPPRFTEASLVKKLEAEGIGRPSTYASIIDVIQNRKYVEKAQGRFHASDLGTVVTDKLVQGFPRIMDVGYTRWMESELDAVEEQHHDWREFLHKFYGPFRENLEKAHELMTHAKAEAEPAPYTCPKCGSPTIYQFGRNGRFLSCSAFRQPPIPTDLPCPKCDKPLMLKAGKTNPTLACSDPANCKGRMTWSKVPDDLKPKFKAQVEALPPVCKYAAPIDREGKPVEPEATDVACPKCGSAMMLRKGRFGPFLSCPSYPECDGIVNLDKKGHVTPPKIPPVETDLSCDKCERPLYLRGGKRGPWLGCSGFPKCRGRMAWSKLEPKEQEKWESALAKHEKANPQPVIHTVDGKAIGDNFTPTLESRQGE
ncbi:MAG: type I DNA topoisomerase, partial [Phycisphaerae bacterium]|nr:type I DNA topoisomerase [Phycisphaerae bacterium]